MIRYGALDPGGKTGAAIYNDLVPQTMQELVVTVNDFESLHSWLIANADITVLIVEGYRNRPVEMTKGHANTWSQNLESQIIGYCRCFCRVHGIEMVIQDASIKPVGYGNAGLKYVKGAKGVHMKDALAHGAYWYINKGMKRA